MHAYVHTNNSEKDHNPAADYFKPISFINKNSCYNYLTELAANVYHFDIFQFNLVLRKIYTTVNLL